MFEKRKRKTENKECVIKVYIFHLRLKDYGIIGGKAPYRRKIQASTNLEQVASCD